MTSVKKPNNQRVAKTITKKPTKNEVIVSSTPIAKKLVFLRDQDGQPIAKKLVQDLTRLYKETNFLGITDLEINTSIVELQSMMDQLETTEHIVELLDDVEDNQDFYYHSNFYQQAILQSRNNMNLEIINDLGSTDIGECKECHKNLLKKRGITTRSIDEPTTTIIFCVNCGSRNLRLYNNKGKLEED